MLEKKLAKEFFAITGLNTSRFLRKLMLDSSKKSKVDYKTRIIEKHRPVLARYEQLLDSAKRTR